VPTTYPFFPKRTGCQPESPGALRKHGGEVNKTLARYETLKKVLLVPDEIHGRRRHPHPDSKTPPQAIQERYRKQIDGLYEKPALPPWRSPQVAWPPSFSRIASSRSSHPFAPHRSGYNCARAWPLPLAQSSVPTKSSLPSRWCMGEVYRAKDTRLDRTVAIKVLPTHLSDDPELKQRMEREAKAISALQHSNICTLYDIGTQDGNRLPWSWSISKARPSPSAWEKARCLSIKS